jgi:hypothetical protein
LRMHKMAGCSLFLAKMRDGEDSSPCEHVRLVLEVQILHLLGPVRVKVGVVVAVVQKAVDLWCRDFAGQRSGALWRLIERGQKGGGCLVGGGGGGGGGQCRQGVDLTDWYSALSSHFFCKAMIRSAAVLFSSLSRSSCSMFPMVSCASLSSLAVGRPDPPFSLSLSPSTVFPFRNSKGINADDSGHISWTSAASTTARATGLTYRTIREEACPPHPGNGGGP